ncbi:fructose bisphosphate aldolase [Sporichthya sp.]|uniref:fructose bisphosphate aldolase n=1 Tax=Sporichthya sp. TaxID=65475 RepID=UPI0017F77B5F|nr:fructose bisphosphate aldolase [Sporichthya sp.]MBA3742049.1 fructose bisphosphate aldolase [Sporichthya sp.]
MSSQRDAMQEKVVNGKGFIAALDQSGGSTPKALGDYGIAADRYSSDAEMFDLMHAMRTRIIKSPAFTGDKVLGAILFEMTMDRQIDGRETPEYLWNERGVVPFLKVDKGLEDTANGVQLMKPIPGLDDLLARAVAKGVYGTKMRSVIHDADPAGIAAIVEQQFEFGAQIAAHGLVPILEPEVSIKSATKNEAEVLLREAIQKLAAQVPATTPIMLKLTIPTQPNYYAPLVAEPHVQRVVALSGGYSRDEACALLAQNPGVIASFSRALVEGVSDGQTDAEFDATLAASIGAIYEASL